jgi:hypothetical protein
MAYTVAISCNDALHEGMTDGAWKKYAMHRGGAIVEGVSAGSRKCMSGVWHGFHEAPNKYLPDGRPCITPNYLDVTPIDPENV